MASKQPRKTRAMMYTQQIMHLPLKTSEAVYDAALKLGPEKLAMIIHDHDIADNGQPAADHLHMMMQFKNPRSLASVAKALGDQPQYIASWPAGVQNGFSYLIHRTDGARGKYQYAPEDVKANFDYATFIQSVETEVMRAQKHANIKILLNDLRDGKIDKETLEDELSGAEYARAKRQIEDVDALRLRRQAREWREQQNKTGALVRTIWLFGPQGVGKTRLAKEIAEKEHRPYFVSGSTRDIFQAYAGQHTLVLDEFRPESMPYQDLLRITDPNALKSEVMAPSRYNDKALACDLIIITSPYDPYSYYLAKATKDGMQADIDGFGQLHRRITLAMEMRQGETFVADYNEQARSYEADPSTAKPNTFSQQNSITPTFDAVDLYNTLLS